MAIATLILVACGARSSNAIRFTSTQEIASAMFKKHLGCDDLMDDSKVRPTEKLPRFWVMLGHCTVVNNDTIPHNDDVTILTYATADDQTKEDDIVKRLGCALADQPHESSSYVRGDRWEVVPNAQSTADRIRAAIGGTVTTVAC